MVTKEPSSFLPNNATKRRINADYLEWTVLFLYTGDLLKEFGKISIDTTTY